MRIVVDYPPIYTEIAAAFDISGRNPIFAWGDRVFNPHNIVIGPELIAHEAVHGRRQGNDVEGWWRRYIDDPAFRLAEEIPAHAAEFNILAGVPGTNRQHKRKCLAYVAKRLTSPIYGRLITLDAAKKAILDEAG
ncbi:MAG: hypothetical protein Q8P46_00405 [Hyphomicrobiales bacterium]|nr:hypothetical protein [Hyphomicrobiales bacterium]